MLAKRKMSVTELSEKLGITMANVSILKNGKAKAVKVETLNYVRRWTASREIYLNMFRMRRNRRGSERSGKYYGTAKQYAATNEYAGTGKRTVCTRI